MKSISILLGLLICLTTYSHASQTTAVNNVINNVINNENNNENNTSKKQIEKTSVWKITKKINGKQQTVFLGGTIHLLRDLDYPLPAAFDIAYNQAKEIIFEVDIDDAELPESQAKMLQLLVLPSNETIEDKLTAQNYKLIESYAAENNIPIQNLNTMTATGLSLVLTQIEMTKFGFTPMGVDAYYDNKAKSAGKKRSFLESFDDQLMFLASMGNEPNKLINYTFKDMHRLRSMMNEMVSAWRKGTELELISIELKTEFPEIYNNLILNRNNAWMPLLENEFMDDEIEFVLVGVGHLTGDDSIVNMFKNKGYAVEQLTL